MPSKRMSDYHTLYTHPYPIQANTKHSGKVEPHSLLRETRFSRWRLIAKLGLVRGDIAKAWVASA